MGSGSESKLVQIPVEFVIETFAYKKYKPIS